MSGRTYANNVNGRGNGASGRGIGTSTNSTNYGSTNAIPGTNALQGTANTIFYPPHSGYHVTQRVPGNPYYPLNNHPPMAMWQQSPPTGSTLGATTSTSTSSNISPANNATAISTTGNPTYAHAPVHSIHNQTQYLHGHRYAMPQQHAIWMPPQGNAAYMSATQMGMMTSTTSMPNATFSTASTTANSAPPPRTRKMPTITDKSGNPIDLTMSKSTQLNPSSDTTTDGAIHQPAPSSVEVSPLPITNSSTTSSHDAGMKLREAAERAIKESGGIKSMKRKDDNERIMKDPGNAIGLELVENSLRTKEENARQQQLEEEENRRQMATKKLLEEEEKTRQEAEEKARKETEDENLRKDAEEKAQRAAEEREKQEAELKIQQEAEDQARRDAEEAATRLKRDPHTSLSSLAARLQMRQGDNDDDTHPSQIQPDTAPTMMRSENAASYRSARTDRTSKGINSLDAKTGKSDASRKVYGKAELLRFRDLKICCARPMDLPEMFVNSSASNANRRGSSQWSRESNKPSHLPQENVRGDNSNRRQSSVSSYNSLNNVSTPADQWTRGLTMQQKNPVAGRGGRGGRGERGGPFGFSHQDTDDIIPPLKRSENRWVPIKDSSAFVVTEKSVKSILNKMTKEKFDKLSDQMCEIKIVSHQMLTMMINHIYEKAIYEPSFSDMYAELCVKLSQTAKKSSFIRIIESDEEPPTDDGQLNDNQWGSSGNPVYRWSNDVNTDDPEIMGPFNSPEECINCAVDEDNCPYPVPRGEMELELHKLRIHRGKFIKIMHVKNDHSSFYTVFFAMNNIEEVKQQVSKEIYLSELECSKDGNKQNNFKRILLYKCEDEFNKKDVYESWKKDKKAHEERKVSLSESERLEKEGELEFRRIKIKKQMLGNIKFIGELYKKEMLKEKIMHYCIQQLLKIDENTDGDLSLIKDDEMDEEDHEALCNLFVSIGRQVDNDISRRQMSFYFKRIAALSTDKNLSSRSRFMYKDLLELKGNKWKARREEETAKTLDEIKKDFEKEERLAAQQSQTQSRTIPVNLNRNTSSGSRGSTRGKGASNYVEGRDDARRDSEAHFRQKPVKDNRDSRSFNKVEDAPPPQILTRGSDSLLTKAMGPSLKPSPSNVEEKKKVSNPEDIIKRKAQSMRSEFIQSLGHLSEEDIIFSFTDITTLPNYAITFIRVNTESGLECKQQERDAVITILSILIAKDRLAQNDFESSFSELLEFLDDFSTDIPQAAGNLGEMIAGFIYEKILNFSWLCERLQDGPNARHFPALISSLIESLYLRYGEKASLRVDIEPYKDCLSGFMGESKWRKAIDD